MTLPTATGGCLCGAVRYEVRGPLRDVIVCHCVECRRSHGTSGAYTSVARDDVSVTDADGALRWFWGPKSATRGERAFCSRCGSSLFWRTPERPTLGITAGTLDGSTGLRIVQHIWDEQRADWEAEDGLPRVPRGT
jgi:hypothetical protein